MSVTGIILAAVIVGGTGLFIGVFLGVAGKKFAVEVDEREEAILGVLPGNNCGGCGYAGCSGLAAAIVKGEAEVGGCPVGGAPVAAKVGEIMGVAAGAQVHEVAFVKCGGDCEKAKQEYEYHGLSDCTMVNMMQDGGPKACSYGCLGDGSCVQACPFDIKAFNVRPPIRKTAFFSDLYKIRSYWNTAAIFCFSYNPISFHIKYC